MRYPYVIFVITLAILTQEIKVLLALIPAILWYHQKNYILDVQPGQVRLLSYNMFMRPGLWFIKHSVSDYKNQRLECFMKEHLQRFDVLALQEMFSMFTLRQQHLLNNSFQYAAVAGSARYGCFNRHGTLNIPLLDAGLVTISKYPISATDTHTYRLGREIDGWLPKQVLWTLLKLPDDAFLNVFNTHMQATHSHRPNRPGSDLVRKTQIKELAEFVAEKTEVYTYPAIICGDFNLDSRGIPLDYIDMMHVLKEHLNNEWELEDLQPEHPITFGCPGETALTHPSDVGSEMCIDYILYYGPKRRVTSQVEEFRQKDQPFTQLSDHFGISCILENGVV